MTFISAEVGMAVTYSPAPVILAHAGIQGRLLDVNCPDTGFRRYDARAYSARRT
jgi:hypothetical protein